MRRRLTKQPETSDNSSIAEKIAKASAQLSSRFVEREEAIRVMWLAIVTGLNAILVGDPGTAKTKLTRALLSHIKDAEVFSKQVGPSTMTTDLVGRFSVLKMKQDVEERLSDGKLIKADFAFLDELLKLNRDVRQMTLDIMSDRRFEGVDCPLRSVISASNWPEVDTATSDATQWAFWDRLHLRCVVSAVQTREGRKQLLDLDLAEDASGPYRPTRGTVLTLAEIDQAREEIARVVVPARVRDLFLDKLEWLDNGGRSHSAPGAEPFTISNRRMIQMQLVARASAWLRGSDRVGLRDLDCLKLMAWDKRSQYQTAVTAFDSIDRDIVASIMRDAARVKQRWAFAKAMSPSDAQLALDELASSALVIKDAMTDFGLPDRSLASLAQAREELRAVYADIDRRFADSLADSLAEEDAPIAIRPR